LKFELAQSASARLILNAIAWLGYGWAVFNCVYVYLFTGGTRTHRVESAILIFAGALVASIAVRPAERIARASWTGLHTMLLFALAGALWLSVLGRLVTLPFLSDDYVFLDRYATWTQAFSSPYFFRPVFAWIFWLVRTIGGGSVVPFRIIGLLLHAASAACVWRLARRVLDSSAAAAIAAAIFLINPLQFEASVWISGLQEELWTFFALLAAVVYTSRAELTVNRLAATAAFAALALLSKETAVSVVLILLLLDIVVRSKWNRLRYVAYGVFLLEIGAYVWGRRHFAVAIDQQLVAAPTRYFVKQFMTTPYRVFTFPWNAAVTNVPGAIACGIALVALTAIFRASRRSPRPLLLGPGLILASTLPLAGYFYVGPDLIGARYVYFAAAGWAILVAECATLCWRARLAQWISAAAIVLALSVALRINAEPWFTAGEFVKSLDAGLDAGRSPSEVAREWHDRHGATDVVNADGVPRTYRGVYIFTNGYSEFLRLRSRGQ
jgi:hypothetical protein